MTHGVSARVGWDGAAIYQQPDEDPAPGASESRTLSQQTWSRASGRHPSEGEREGKKKSAASPLVLVSPRRGRAARTRRGSSQGGQTGHKWKSRSGTSAEATTALTTGWKSVWRNNKKKLCKSLGTVLGLLRNETALWWFDSKSGRCGEGIIEGRMWLLFCEKMAGEEAGAASVSPTAGSLFGAAPL